MPSMIAATGTAINRRSSAVVVSSVCLTNAAYSAGDAMATARKSVENRAIPNIGSGADQAQPLAEHGGPGVRGRRPPVEQRDRQPQRQRAGRVPAGERRAQ